jgi:hypothetical protein
MLQISNPLTERKKGQINIEFLAAAGLFLITVVGLIASNQVLPSYSSSMDRMTLNLEAKTLTDQMVTEPGRHSFGAGGDNWEKNESTIDNVEAVGIASEHHVLSRSKLDRLQTATVGGSEGLNYTEFRETASLNNQYRFNFVWLPTIQTNYSFIKNSPPSNPNIIEPETSSYASADNRVHYGDVNLQGSSYKMLVTSHNGAYDSLYVSQGDWDFSSSNPEEPYRIGEEILENGFEVESFQNRDNSPGELVIIRRKIKDFGPTVNTNTEVATIDRFAVLEGEPVRIEVSVW